MDDSATPHSATHPGDLVVTEVSKHFGGVSALTDVSLTIRAGSCHALIGESGAGKSTLGKIVAGVVTPDEGTLSLGGRSLHLRSARNAMAHGIITIAQEFAIVPGLSVAENVYLGGETSSLGFLRRRELRRRFRELAALTDFSLSADQMAGTLSAADRQKVEIMRALSRDASIVIMDEPTAALSDDDTIALHKIVRTLVREGTTVVLISHFLTEVLALADTITTLRDGRLVETVEASEASEESLIEGMLGRPLSVAFPAKRPPQPDAPLTLEVEHLRAPGVDDCSLQVRRGEIVGIAGLVGAGKSEFARAIYRDAKSTVGTVRIGGSLEARNPHGSVRGGVTFIPESRQDMGLLMGRSVKDNVSLSRLDLVSRLGWLLRRREQRVVGDFMGRATMKAASMRQRVSMLSGGNQQRILFARALMSTPRLLIVDEPTRGVDVGTKRAIYDLLVDLAESGTGIIVITSEFEEVMGLAHRIVVMRHGRMVADLMGDDMTQQNVMQAAFIENAS